MHYEVEKPSATQIAITVRAPHSEIEPLVKPAAEKISSQTEIEGFRKGHAPYEIVKQKVGEFKILEEAARMYIDKNFTSILEDIENKEYKDKSFETVGAPEVIITKLAPGEELEFKITLLLLPALELPNYKTIAKEILATKKVPETTEKEVADAVQWLCESRAKLITVNRAAGAGDRVEIDFSATMGGVALEGGESKNHPFILGRSRFIPGFEEAITGMKAGEEKTFSLAVPADYGDRRIAGKKIDFEAAMRQVQERDVPAWNDEFAKSLGNFPTAADAEKSIRQGLTIKKEEKEKERLRMAMAEAIAAKTRTEIPEPLIERELEKMTAELKDSIAGMGLQLADYLSHIKKTEDDLRREWRGNAERRVKIALVLREIARRESISPSEEEIQETINRTMAHRGMSGEDVKKLDRRAFIDYNAGMARNEKVFQRLESSINE